MSYPIPTIAKKDQRYYLAWGCLIAQATFGFLAVFSAAVGNTSATNAALTASAGFGPLTGCAVAWYFKGKDET